MLKSFLCNSEPESRFKDEYLDSASLQSMIDKMNVNQDQIDKNQGLAITLELLSLEIDSNNNTQSGIESNLTEENIYMISMLDEDQIMA